MPKQPKKTSKYLRIHGQTLQQISDQTGLSIGIIHELLTGKRRKRHADTIRKFRAFKEEVHDAPYCAGDGGTAPD